MNESGHILHERLFRHRFGSQRQAHGASRSTGGIRGGHDRPVSISFAFRLMNRPAKLSRAPDRRYENQIFQNEVK